MTRKITKTTQEEMETEIEITETEIEVETTSLVIIIETIETMIAIIGKPLI